jgi:hypothetical protein
MPRISLREGLQKTIDHYLAAAGALPSPVEGVCESAKCSAAHAIAARKAGAWAA